MGSAESPKAKKVVYEIDDYDLIPDATIREEETLPTYEELNKQDLEKIRSNKQ